MASKIVRLVSNVRTGRAARLGIFGLLILIASCPPISGQDSSALTAALDQLRNNPKTLESLQQAFEAFFPVDHADLPKGQGYAVPEADADPLPKPQPVVSAKTPPFSSEAIFDLRQSMRREFAKAAGGGEGFITIAQLRTMASAGKLPFSEDADSYFDKHDQDADGRLNLREFTPTPTEVAAKCDLETLTQKYLDGSSYEPGLPSMGGGPGQKGKQWRGGRTP